MIQTMPVVTDYVTVLPEFIKEHGDLMVAMYVMYVKS